MPSFMEEPVAQKDPGSLDTFEEEMLAIIRRVKVLDGFEAPGTTSLTCGNEEAHQDQTQAGTQQSVRGSALSPPPPPPPPLPWVQTVAPQTATLPPSQLQMVPKMVRAFEKGTNPPERS
jgi:hypothetical protein